MTLECQVFWLPKRGNSTEEYEDASASEPDRGRFAVADGASESSFAGLWAKMLVEKFVRAPLLNRDTWAKWLAPLQNRWSLQIGSNGTLPWYAEAKKAEGAFATFLGIVLHDSTWEAIAIGDNCLFQVRKGFLVQAGFPIKQANAFNQTPCLVGSCAAPQTVAARLQHQKGTWEKGDHFFLMTDALSQWFLCQFEAGKRPWATLEALLSQSRPFSCWIDERREKEAMRNDDVTLIAITAR